MLVLSLLLSATPAAMPVLRPNGPACDNPPVRVRQSGEPLGVRPLSQEPAIPRHRSL
jgi:hypothetical protein